MFCYAYEYLNGDMFVYIRKGNNILYMRWTYATGFSWDQGRRNELEANNTSSNPRYVDKILHKIEERHYSPFGWLFDDARKMIFETL